jgi:toxin-antitoxin system PIN domain toxin
MIALLDVNVLVALFDPSHLNHEDAHAWFGRNRRHGWATCPLTSNGCVRVLSHPSYPTVETTAEMASRLRELTSARDHHFWVDSVAITDVSLFRPEMIAGPRPITDVYLLGLAVHNKGALVTFDRSISTKAVIGAKPENLKVLGGAAPS